MVRRAPRLMNVGSPERAYLASVRRTLFSPISSAVKPTPSSGMGSSPAAKREPGLSRPLAAMPMAAAEPALRNWRRGIGTVKRDFDAAIRCSYICAGTVLQRPRMLDKLTIDALLPLVGSSFWLFHGDHKVEMRLERAAPVMASEAARLKRQAFSLYFLAPLVVPQGIHRVKHDAFPEPLDI